MRQCHIENRAIPSARLMRDQMVLKEPNGCSGNKGQQAKICRAMPTLDHWHAMPKGFEGNFDAILNGDGPFSGNCYIFKGDSYIKFDWSSGSAVQGYPKKIAGNWPGMPSDFCHDIDAAINGQGPFAGNCYFFKGDSYVKFDWKNDRAYSDCPKKSQATGQDCQLVSKGTSTRS